MKKTMKKWTSFLVAMALVLAMLTTAMADTIYTSDGFTIPSERIAGVRIPAEVIELVDYGENEILIAEDKESQEVEKIIDSEKALDEHDVDGLVVVDGKDNTENNSTEEQTKVSNNNEEIEPITELNENNIDSIANDENETDNICIEEIVPDESATEEEIATQNIDNAIENEMPEIEISYLQDEEGNVILDDNGNPVSYVLDNDTSERQDIITYVRDENNILILDITGEPIPIVPEGVDIPVRYQRDVNGQLVLDDNGDPVPIQTIAAGSQKGADILDELDPNRSISMYFNYFGKTSVKFGEEFQIIAVAKGYDNVNYSFQWQYSLDGENWVDIEGETASTMNVLLTPMNFRNWWRVGILIDDIQ